MNTAIQWNEFAVAVPILLAVGGIVWRMSAEMTKLRTETDAKIARLRTELTEYKVEVAEKYVSAKSMRELEDRLIDSINRLGDRLDRVLEKSSQGS